MDKTMIQLVALLLAVYSMSITTVLAQITASCDNNNIGFCCGSQSRPVVKPVDVDLKQIVNDSPNHEFVISPNMFTQDLDNVCYTYFPIDSVTALQFTGERTSNGSCIISKYIVGGLPGYSGVSRVQGLAFKDGSSSLIYDEVYLGSACQGLRVYYRNFIAGRCDILESATNDLPLAIHGDSPCRDVSDYCKSQVEGVANSQQLGFGNLMILPYRLNSCCVTQFNGVSCINAYKVRPEDSVTLNGDGSTCPTY